LVVRYGQINQISVFVDRLVEIKLKVKKFLKYLWWGLVLDCDLQGSLLVGVLSFRVDIVSRKQFFHIEVVIEDDGSLKRRLTLSRRFLHINSRVPDQEGEYIIVLCLHGKLQKGLAGLGVELINVKGCLLKNLWDFLDVALFDWLYELVELVHLSFIEFFI